MLRGYRGILVAFAGLAATFSALGVGAYFGALNAPHYGYQAGGATNRAAYDELANPGQIDRDRAGLPYFAERIASGSDPRDGTEREKRDLAAQESMSVWAFWMLFVAAFSAVTTAVGTGFLLWQIILTRKAVEDTGKATVAMNTANDIANLAMAEGRRANDIMAESKRSWLFCQIEPLSVTPSGVLAEIEFRLTIKNVGETACGVRLDYLTVFDGLGDIIGEIDRLDAGRDKAIRAEDHDLTYLVPGAIWTMEATRNLAPGAFPDHVDASLRGRLFVMPCVMFAATYFDIGIDKLYYARDAIIIGERKKGGLRGLLHDRDWEADALGTLHQPKVMLAT